MNIKKEKSKINERIYVTHCSAKKNNSFYNSNQKIVPHELYTTAPLQRFVKICQEKQVRWAIFSDKYGVVFPNDKIGYYDKHPNTVTSEEFQLLLEDFVQKLSKYPEIWFYHNPGRFHKLYKNFLDEVKKRGLKVKLFSHLSEIN